jgi:hypothetical protein
VVLFNSVGPTQNNYLAHVFVKLKRIFYLRNSINIIGPEMAEKR